MSCRPAHNFNSRPSARGDYSCPASSCSIRRFQFTPLREGRRCCYPPFAIVSRFQFTPLREGRPRRGRLSGQRRGYFNSRPSARGDALFPSFELLIKEFQFTPLREGRHNLATQACDTRKFQFTPLREGRLDAVQYEHSQDYFNSRPSARGDSFSSSRRRFRAFQFTPLREGRLTPFALPVRSTHFNSRPSARGDLVELSAITGLPYISIHAPPRGATSIAWTKAGTKVISIHAPPRGATIILATCLLGCGYFNSRPSARGDDVAKDKNAFNKISIHAPPRGATRKLQTNLDRIKFQFTPLREGRHARREGEETAGYFNSRPSARGDVALVLRRLRLAISIHAPPRGATTASRVRLANQSISIHAPPRGATGSVISSVGMQKFQFTPLREGRPDSLRRYGTSRAFQFTPLREGRPTLSSRWRNGRKFQFTPLREGRRNRQADSGASGNFNSRPSARGDKAVNSCQKAL